MKATLNHRIRSKFFDIAVVLVTIPIGILLGLLGPILTLNARFWIVKTWRHCFTFFEHKILGISIEIVGSEHIPNVPCIIISNHQSAWETVGLQSIFYPCVFVLKEELLKIPFFGWGLKSIEMIAIDRDSSKTALKKVVEQGSDRLRKGISVVIFPEGTRADPGSLLPFQIGGAYLASKCNVPVVPVAHNAGRIWPRGSSVKGPGTVRVVIGKPIMPGLRATELNASIESWIRMQNL